MTSSIISLGVQINVEPAMYKSCSNPLNLVRSYTQISSKDKYLKIVNQENHITDCMVCEFLPGLPPESMSLSVGSTLITFCIQPSNK